MDRRGVMGLPVRLGVALLILALTAPSLVAAAEHFDREAEVSELRLAADTVYDAAGRVWYSGSGGCETVDVSVPSGCSIVFGGEGADAWSYALYRNGEEVSREYPETPAVRFLGSSEIAGSGEIKIVCRNADGGYGVEVTPL